MKHCLFLCALIHVFTFSKSVTNFDYGSDIDNYDTEDDQEYEFLNFQPRRNPIFHAIFGSTTSNFVCSEEGKTCDSCNRLVTCSSSNNGKFTKTLSRCRGRDNYCLRVAEQPEDPPPDPPVDALVTASCEPGPNPLCDGTAKLKFPCTGPGVFPDPFICERYYLCKSERGFGIPINCKTGFAYNLLSGQCDISKTAAINDSPNPDESGCNNYDNVYPVPMCKKEGDGQALFPVGPKEDGQTTPWYYICTNYRRRLYPFIYRCDGQQIYDEVDLKKCIDPPPAGAKSVLISNTRKRFRSTKVNSTKS